MARGKKASAEAAAPGDPGARVLRLADHPRATRHIRLGRAWGALVAFAAVLVLSLRAGVPVDPALMRALASGVAAYVAMWAVMVLVWRQLAEAEIEAARRKIVAALVEMEAAEREAA